MEDGSEEDEDLMEVEPPAPSKKKKSAKKLKKRVLEVPLTPKTSLQGKIVKKLNSSLFPLSTSSSLSLHEKNPQEKQAANEPKNMLKKREQLPLSGKLA